MARRDLWTGGALVVSMGLAAWAGAAEREVVEAILARVNDRVVTVSEFSERLRQDAAQIDPPPTAETIDDFAAQLLDNVVNEMVLLERAVEKGIVADDEAIDQYIDSLRQETGLEDDAAFAEALRQSFMTVEDLRERYRRSFLIQRASQGETQPTELTEQEIRDIYEAEKEQFAVPAKVELEQIVFPVAEDGSDRDQVRRRVEGLLERVREGSDLTAEATLAGVEVQELDGIPVQDLRPELKEVLADVAEGEFTEPLANPGGWVVLRLVRRVPAGHLDFEEVKEQIRRRESERRFMEERRAFVDRLKERYLVEVHEDRLAAIVDQVTGDA